MVSSSIVGLEDVRDAIRIAIEGLGIAESWLFEFNAVAAGAAPDKQYLEKARDADLFVLVVGDEIRSGTEAEYNEAFRDSPRKILPFFLDGPEGTSGPFRALIRARHTYRTVARGDLPGAVAAAACDAVRTGEVSRESLRGLAAGQQAALRSLLALPDGFAFDQRINMAGETVPPDRLLMPEGRVVLEGEPGAGKTDIALSALVARSDDFLPIYCRARHGSTLVELIEGVFDSVRFTPGINGIRQFLRDGRLALVIDGADELGGSDKATFLSAIGSELSRYPRSVALVLVRSVTHPALAGWTLASPARLTESDIEALFDVLGHRGEQRLGVFAKLAELVRLPFWAPAVARFGLTANSGPTLLDEVVRARLKSTLPDDDVGQERLHDAIGYLARRLRPAVEAEVAPILREIHEWASSEVARARYEPLPAETVLDQVRRTGLLLFEQGRARFIHPLIAAHLAARHTIEFEDLASLPQDEDLRAFAAALLPENRAADWLNVLRSTSPFVLFRALQLTGLLDRASDLAADLRRFDVAYKDLAPLGGREVERAADGRTTAALDNPPAVCLRSVPGLTATLDRGRPLEDWFGPSRPARFTCWTRNPFLTRWPEQLAAEQVLRSLKRVWADVNPGGNPYGRLGAEISAVVDPREMLPQRLVAHLHAVAAARNALIEAAGLEQWLIPWSGFAAATVWLGVGDARFAAVWGQAEDSVDIRDGDGTRIGRSLFDMLADPPAVAYRDLTSELDGRFDGTLRSGSVRGPQPMAWSL